MNDNYFLSVIHAKNVWRHPWLISLSTSIQFMSNIPPDSDFLVLQHLQSYNKPAFPFSRMIAIASYLDSYRPFPWQRVTILECQIVFLLCSKLSCAICHTQGKLRPLPRLTRLSWSAPNSIFLALSPTLPCFAHSLPQPHLGHGRA